MAEDVGVVSQSAVPLSSSSPSPPQCPGSSVLQRVRTTLPFIDSFSPSPLSTENKEPKPELGVSSRSVTPIPPPSRSTTPMPPPAIDAQSTFRSGLLTIRIFSGQSPPPPSSRLSSPAHKAPAAPLSPAPTLALSPLSPSRALHSTPLSTAYPPRTLTRPGRGLAFAPGVHIPEIIQKALDGAPAPRTSTGSHRESMQRRRYWWLPYVVLEFDKNEILIDALGGDLANPIWNYRANL